MSSIALLSAMALGRVLSTIVRKVLIQAWLSQRQEHEADVTGAAISEAAGCTSQEILLHDLQSF